ncbi:MAG: winged helix-turn-helix transcriptional regulator [Candidatus Hodarchaeales archaeon]
MLGRKWSIKVLYILIHEGNSLFSELQKSIHRCYGEKISAKALSNCLKELEESKLITRKILFETSPIRILYSLTEKGQELEFFLITLRNWSSHWEKRN